MDKSDKPLNKKQRGFVRDFLVGENGKQAILNNYNTTSESSARSMAVENLHKPHIQKAILKLMDENGLNDKMLLKKHLALLNKEEVITRTNIKSGETEITRTGEIDTQAVKSALDMAYKIKGHFAQDKKDDEKQVNIAFILNNLND